MGEVYRARDTRLERQVAIKVLASSLADDPEFTQRFHTEARAISQLAHPHICTLHDISEYSGTTFLVMEFLPGETLADRLARGTPERPALTTAQALQIGIQIADALAAAHQSGIIHRDLKPGNVMLTKAGGAQAGMPHAKLLDFGLAKTAATFASDFSPTTPPQAVTTQGAILGTIQYMAPEQIDGGIAGRSQRHLCLRVPALRDVDRPQGVRGEDAREHHGGHSGTGAGTALGPGCRDARSCRGDGAEMSGEEP
jgi:serine/threonine protein kinase